MIPLSRPAAVRDVQRCFFLERIHCEDAARNGHLDALQRARANGCPWNAWTCARAAENGHLEVLQWVKS